MERQINYKNYVLDPSEESFRKKIKDIDDVTHFPLEESQPTHY